MQAFMTLKMREIYPVAAEKGWRSLAKRLGALKKSPFGDTFEKVFMLSAAHAVSGLLMLATFVLLANKLGPRLYGEFTFVDSVLFIAILCASLGTEYVGNREVARSSDSRELVNGVLLLRSVASLAAFAVIVAWTLLFIDSPTLRPLMLISAGVLLSVPGIAGWYFLAKHRIRIVAFVTLIREAAFFIPVLLILDLIEDPERKLLFAGVFYFLSRLIFALVFLVRLLAENGFCLKVKRATYSFLFKDSLALLYASIVSSVTIGMQIYMLKLLGEEFALGVYGALFKQIFYIQLLSLSFIMVFFPLLSRAWVEDRARYSRLASALSELTLVVVLPIAMTGVLYPDYILSLFFTPEYAQGGLALQLLCLSLIPMSYVRVLTTGVLISMDMTSKMYSLVNIAFVGSLFSGLVIFAFQGADAGAAASRLLAECLFAAVSYRVVASKVRVITAGLLWCVIPGAVSMVLVSFIIPKGHELLGMIACYASFFAVYLIGLFYGRLDEIKDALSASGRGGSEKASEKILIEREET